MWHAAILLHRPFIARWPSNPSASKSTSSPLDVCLQAANQICFTLEHYFERLLGLPCDMVFSIFTAASTLLYHSKHSKSEDIENQRRLKLCIHWLSVLGKSWKSAGARQELLADSRYFPNSTRSPLTCEVFKMPGTLQEPTSRTIPERPQVTHNSSQPPATPSNQTFSPAPSHVIGTGSSSSLVPSPQDWGFLRDFGDSTDEFYELDVQLRGLLDGGFESEQLSFLT
jgi:hypothetical protein